jgi:ribonucleoside-triphosphate reductase
MIENVVRWAYENTNINYIGMNFHIRYCRDCAAKANQERSKQTMRSSIVKTKKKVK